jgi:hypothetical protein
MAGVQSSCVLTEGPGSVAGPSIVYHCVRCTYTHGGHRTGWHRLRVLTSRQLDDGETAHSRRFVERHSGYKAVTASVRAAQQWASSGARCAAIGRLLQGSSGGAAEKLGYRPGWVRFARWSRWEEERRPATTMLKNHCDSICTRVTMEAESSSGERRRPPGKQLVQGRPSEPEPARAVA